MLGFRRKLGPGGVRRQWGADTHENPMPVVPRIAGEWSMLFGRVAVVVTVAAWAALVITVLGRAFRPGWEHAGLIETFGFLFAVTMLAASALAYLVGRLGFYYRANTYRRVPRAVIDEFFATSQPRLTAISPSYQEEPGVILMTLLSVALQEYPDINVVLLLDDPPEPRYTEPRQLLDSAVALPEQIEQLLAEPRARFGEALERFLGEADWDQTPSADVVRDVAGDYAYAANWLGSLRDRYGPADHNEHFFAMHVIGQLASDMALTAGALRAAAEDDSGKLTFARLVQLRRRLAWTFSAKSPVSNASATHHCHTRPTRP